MKKEPVTNSEFDVSKQAQFATSKLIQNLGTKREKYRFEGSLRSVWGRD
tara:strand:+ start:931 stop:1077 length:147 start_codon:yes stop_codon:yes gene_type:complete